MTGRRAEGGFGKLADLLPALPVFLKNVLIHVLLRDLVGDRIQPVGWIRNRHGYTDGEARLRRRGTRDTDRWLAVAGTPAKLQYTHSSMVDYKGEIMKLIGKIAALIWTSALLAVGVLQAAVLLLTSLLP